MAVTFRLVPHGVLADIKVVQILVDGENAGVIYPNGEKNIKILSAHIVGTYTHSDFSGAVLASDGQETVDAPIPSVLIHFNPRNYKIVDGRIVRQT